MLSQQANLGSRSEYLVNNAGFGVFGYAIKRDAGHPQRRFDRGVCPGPPGIAVYYTSKSSLCMVSQGMF